MLTTILEVAGILCWFAFAAVLVVLAVSSPWWPAALPIAGTSLLAVSWLITRAGPLPRTWRRRKARL